MVKRTLIPACMFTAFFFTTCRKYTTPPTADIEYGTVVAGAPLTSLRSFTVDSHHRCDFFSPADSTAYSEIDLDKDGETDLRLKYAHRRDPASCPSGPCQNKYEESLELIPLHKACFVAQDTIVDGAHRAKRLEYNDVLHNKLDWHNGRAYLFHMGPCGYHSPNFYPPETSCFGFKVNNKFAWFHMELRSHKAVIREMAFNHVENNALVIGQR